MKTEWLLVAGSILLLDQMSKLLVLSRFETKVSYPLGSRPRIRLVTNPHVFLGLIRDKRLLVVLWGVSVLGTVLAIQHTPLLQGPTAHIGLGTAIGGATGNLIDLLRRGAVIDFIDIRIWPVFNLADVAIVLGAAIALWSLVGLQLGSG
jgi:signal peptidase II